MQNVYQPEAQAPGFAQPSACASGWYRYQPEAQAPGFAQPSACASGWYRQDIVLSSRSPISIRATGSTQNMSRRMRKLIDLIRNHPLCTIVCLLVLSALFAVGGCYFWQAYNFGAAVRDLENQNFAAAIKHLERVWPKGLDTHFLLARTARR